MILNKLRCSLLILCVLVSTTVASQQKEEFNDLIESGELIKARDYLISQPELDNEIHQLAGLYYTLGNYSLAEKTYESYLTKDATNVAWKLGLAKTYLNRAYNDKAKDLYLELFQQDSSNVSVLLSLAKLDKANYRDYYERLIRIDSLNPSYPYQIGLNLSKSRHLFNAEPYYIKAHELDPDNLLYLIRLASLYDDIKEPKLAELYIDKGLALSPKNSAFVKMKLAALYKRKAYNEVVVLGLSRFEKSPKDVTAVQYLGLSYMKLENYEQAERFLMLYWMLEKSDPKASYYLGLMYEQSKNYDRAVSFFSMAQNMNDKENDNVYYHMAQVFYAQEKPESAYEYYLKAFDANRNMSKALYNAILLAKNLDIDQQKQYAMLEDYFGRFESRNKKRTTYVQAEMKRVRKDLFMQGVTLE
ncbi:MAG: tetratricopeptide repeat protein [Flavobacteriaceae bacterium]